MYLQQGDILLFLENIPTDAKLIELKNGIVEYGEHTGHKHKLDNYNFEYFETPIKSRHLRLVEPVSLLHEEHAPIVIPPGDYRIGKVVEKEMFGDMVNPVVD